VYLVLNEVFHVKPLWLAINVLMNIKETEREREEREIDGRDLVSHNSSQQFVISQAKILGNFLPCLKIL